MELAIIYILLSVVLSAAGQVILKKGMLTMGPLTLTLKDILNILWSLATNPYIVVGLLIYVCGTVFWLTALSRVDLSYAYPFASLSYIVMLIASWGLFNEKISLLRLVGTFVVCLGVMIIARSR